MKYEETVAEGIKILYKKEELKIKLNGESMLVGEMTIPQIKTYKKQVEKEEEMKVPQIAVILNSILDVMDEELLKRKGG